MTSIIETVSCHEPTWFHLVEQLLVEQTARFLVEWAVDGNNITLAEHVLEILDSPAADFLLHLLGERLVIEVEEFLAVEGLQAAKNSLTNATYGHGADHFVLEIVLVLSHFGHVPITTGDLFVRGDKVADEHENGHEHVLGDGNDVGARNFGDGDAAIGLVGGVQIDMVGTDTGGDGDFEVLGFGQTFGGQIAGMEPGEIWCQCLLVLWPPSRPIPLVCGVKRIENSRSRNNDLSVSELLVKLAVLALLIRGGDESVTLVFEPFTDT